MRPQHLLAAAMLAALGSQAAFANDSAASDEGAKLGFVLAADLEYGGDDFVTVNFEDGDSQDIKTGQGLALALGGQYKPSASSPFAVRATVGYKFVTTAASNADIGINRMVYEALGSYRWSNDFWLGAGVTRHSNIKFDGDGFGPDVSFDDATGPTLELGWKWIALTYTDLDYTDEFGGEWDASSLGLTLTSKF